MTMQRALAGSTRPFFGPTPAVAMSLGNLGNLQQHLGEPAAQATSGAHWPSRRPSTVPNIPRSPDVAG